MGEVTGGGTGASELLGRERKEHLAFVTGKLAEFSLRKTLEDIAPRAGFHYTVSVLPISVAALMTPPWVAAHLRLDAAPDRVVLPGHCRGDLGPVSAAAGAPAVLGPKDLRDLPAWLSGPAAEVPEGARPPGYGAHSLEIIAEINHANRLPGEDLLAAARRHRADGADVIDLGCEPGLVWEGLGEAVRTLRGEGLRVSADTVEPREMTLAARAGAELILSVSGATLAAARDLGCAVVVVPDRPSSLEGLAGSVEKLEEWRVPYRIDPILEPIGKVLGFLILGDPMLRPVSEMDWPIVLKDPPLVPITTLPGLQLRPLSPTLLSRPGG